MVETQIQISHKKYNDVNCEMHLQYCGFASFKTSKRSQVEFIWQ